MIAEKKTWLITIVLCTTAGFCDALTYVAAKGLFSAHVTGNFILFATNLVNTTGHDPWVKLLTLPVFIVSVITGGVIGKKSTNAYFLLLIESLLLVASGIVAFIAWLSGLLLINWVIYFIAMMIVCSLGIQNAFGKLFSKETYGPTTMMTGNVTQWALDLKNLLFRGSKDTTTILSFKKNSITIIYFLGGCLAGAVAGKYIGLDAVFFAGIAMMVCYTVINKN